MNIAHLTPTLYSYSGIDRVVMMLARQQVADGHVVKIITLDSHITAPLGIEIINLGMPKKLFWQRVYRLLMFLDRRKITQAVSALEGYPTIYSHQYPMNLIAEAAKKKYGSTYIYYDSGIPGPEVFSSLIEKIYIVLFRFVTNATIRRADRAISISAYLQNILREQTGVTSQVVHDRADESVFRPDVDGQEIRHKLQLSSTDRMILFVGRISPHKGLHYLFDSFQLVRKRHPNSYLVIVGKPTFSKYLQLLQSKADSHTIFSGFVSDDELPKYFAACDLYATASLWEGFDLPLVEAQAMRKPVVAYDIGPHAELIDQHGMLVPKSDVSAFAAAVSTILDRTKNES